MEGKQIGEVGVDSGQLVVCDPCYIDSEWGREEFKDIRRYENVETGKIYQFGKDFKSYEDDIDGETPNQLIKYSKWKFVSVEDKPIHNFSYNACCKASMKEDGNQLNYKAGHPGVAVCFSSGLGDGVYPVFAEYMEVTPGDKRIKRVTIEFLSEEEDGSDKT